MKFRNVIKDAPQFADLGKSYKARVIGIRTQGQTVVFSWKIYTGKTRTKKAK